MKKQPVTLAIPTPCHENWQQMTPAEQGRFCQSCQKTVMDFTAKTDREVAHYFDKGAKDTCGRFRPDQLQRPLHLERPDGFGARLRALGLVVPGMLFGGFAQAQTDRPVLLGKVACPSPTAIATPIVKVEVKPLVMGDTVVVEQKKNRTITGTVLDAETGDPLIGANVLIKGTQLGAIADMDGKYQLEIPLSMTNPTLTFSYVGYESFEVILAEGQQKVEARLSPGSMHGEICIVGAIAIKKDETLYQLVKQKTRRLLRSWRHHRTEKPQEQQIFEEPQPISLPEPPQPKVPAPALHESLTVEVFPNPFSNDLNLRFESPAAERLTIRLTDMQGRLVFTKIYEAMKGPQVVALDPGAVHLPSGQYLLELSSEAGLRFAGVVVKG